MYASVASRVSGLKGKTMENGSWTQTQLLSGGKDTGKTKSELSLKPKSTKKNKKNRSTKKTRSMKFQELGIKVNKETAKQSGKIRQLKVQRKKFKVQIIRKPEIKIQRTHTMGRQEEHRHRQIQ